MVFARCGARKDTSGPAALPGSAGGAHRGSAGGRPPRLVTAREPARTPAASAGSTAPSESHAARKAPQNASPAPVVSIAETAGAGADQRDPSAAPAMAPAAPRLMTTRW